MIDESKFIKMLNPPWWNLLARWRLKRINRALRKRAAWQFANFEDKT